MHYFLASICLFFVGILTGFAQLSDDFSDGDFTANPVWGGDAGLFTITAGELNSQSPGAAVYYLSTASTIATSAQWEFYFDFQFSTSGANFADIYLMADVADLNLVNNGYFVRIGNTADEISLYKKVAGVESMIIDGVDGLVNSSSSNPFNIRVSRNASDLWNLEYDDGAIGSFVSAGTIVNAEVNSSNFFGVLIEQSGAAGPINSHFFDNIVVGNIPVDVTPPSVSSVSVISNTELDVLFSEPVDQITAETTTNYSASSGLGNPASAIQDGVNPALIHLTFTPFTNGQTDTLTIQNVEDLSTNAMVSDTLTFMSFVPAIPSFKDVVINEIFADPSPQIGLPAAEFVELYNASDSIFDLNGWTFSDPSTTSTLGSYILQPGEYVIIADDGFTLDFSVYPNVLFVTTFPSLNNTGDNLSLLDNSAALIDQVTYSVTWYQDPIKDNGGYSLELINPTLLCTDSSNWIGSNHLLGGTPGEQNSVYDATPDAVAPSILSTDVLSPTVVDLCFDESLDTSNILVSQFSCTGGINISSVISNNTSCLSITLLPAIDTGVVYTLTLNGMGDCSGNTVSNITVDIIFVGDTVAPTISSITVISGTELDVLFNEPVEQITAETNTNYSASSGLGNPTSAIQDGVDPALIHLTFGIPFISGQSETLTVQNVKDLSNNTMVTEVQPFMYFIPATPAFKNVVINEILADPSPVIGLPNQDFIELYNASDSIFDLNGWVFSDAASSVTLGSYILQPGEYVIIIDDSFPFPILYPNILLVTTFPSLNISSDDLSLQDNASNLIDQVSYSITWYQDPIKDNGGYSLELINPALSCTNSSNWIGSNHSFGGTPGEQNSVYDATPDVNAPSILSADVLSSTTLDLCFNESLDTSNILVSQFSCSGGISVNNISINANVSCLTVTLSPALDTGIVYTLTLNGMGDCSGNTVSNISVEMILPHTGQTGDLIINEVLFNPYTGADDFVEIYNNSEKYIDLINWKLANWDDGIIDNYKSITSHFLMSPGDYAVLSKDSIDIQTNYLNSVLGTFVQMSTLPTYSNDSGTVFLILPDVDSTVSDYFSYDEDLQFGLLNNPDGVSLERIDFDRETNDPTNWHSAAESVGWATPGFENSQYFPGQVSEGMVSVEPEIFSPDNDGIDDVLNINYLLDAPGYVGNVTIYDANGRIIRHLIQNELLASDGTISWDGLNNNREKARIGMYLIYFEVFDLSGNVSGVKNSCVLASRFE